MSETRRASTGVARPDFGPVQSEKRAPCGHGCPNSADIRGWLGLIAQHRRLGISRDTAFERAWRVIVDVNPFPASVGRICPHPCQTECNRTELEGAVQVNHMEQFLGDWALARALAFEPLAPAGSGASIGVIGAGPAGLSAAYQLARRGHSVTLYDRNPEPGGMLRYGIPDYRLPPEVLSAEVDRILALDVAFQPRVRIGEDLSLVAVRDQHDAVFLGIGAQRPRRLSLEGTGPSDLRTGVEYLRAVSEGASPCCGGRVVVIGGGNTAVDAARTARRAGSEVTVIYRRARAQMPAFEDEVVAMLDEGVELRTLAMPVRYEASGDQGGRILLQQMRLEGADASGRPRPVPVPDALTWVDCDGVIEAIAQEVDWTGLEELRSLVTGEEARDHEDGTGAVWVGGDVIGAGLASRAIAEGRWAAYAIHAELTGSRRPEPGGEAVASIDTVVMPALYEEEQPVSLIDFASAKQEEGATAMVAEASRCMSCGLCFGCQRCWMYCAAECFVLADDLQPGRYYELDVSACESCGKCVDVCPTGYLEFSTRQASVDVSSASESEASFSPVMVSMV